MGTAAQRCRREETNSQWGAPPEAMLGRQKPWSQAKAGLQAKPGWGGAGEGRGGSREKRQSAGPAKRTGCREGQNEDEETGHSGRREAGANRDM